MIKKSNFHPFILSDESLNRKGLIISTEGMNIDEFNDNPIMLYDHDTSKVIGTWASCEKIDGKVMAYANFDIEDDFALEVKRKVEKGILKKCSVGLKGTKYHLNEDGALVIDESVLYECSIVPIPANTNATRLNIDGEVFSIGVDDDVDAMLLSLNKLKVEGDVALDATEVESVVEPTTVVEEPIEESKDEPVEPVEPKDEEVETPATDVENGVGAENTASISTFSENLPCELYDTMETTISTTIDEVETLKLSVETFKAEVDTLKLELNKAIEELNDYKAKDKAKEIELYVEDTIRSGKYAPSTKEGLIKLATADFESFKSVSETLQTKVISNKIPNIDSVIVDEKLGWNIRDWEKKDPSGLKAMKDSSPERYNTLYDAFYNK